MLNSVKSKKANKLNPKSASCNTTQVNNTRIESGNGISKQQSSSQTSTKETKEKKGKYNGQHKANNRKESSNEDLPLKEASNRDIEYFTRLNELNNLNKKIIQHSKKNLEEKHTSLRNFLLSIRNSNIDEPPTTFLHRVAVIEKVYPMLSEKHSMDQRILSNLIDQLVDLENQSEVSTAIKLKDEASIITDEDIDLKVKKMKEFFSQCSGNDFQVTNSAICLDLLYKALENNNRFLSKEFDSLIEQKQALDDILNNVLESISVNVEEQANDTESDNNHK